MSEIWLNLPMPPSLNNAFPTSKTGRRFKSSRYKAWSEEAGWELKRYLKGAGLRGPVRLLYAFNEKETRADLGNLEKPVTDLLVTHGVIDGDSKRVVRGIQLEWGTEGGVAVTVSPAALRAGRVREEGV